MECRSPFTWSHEKSEPWVSLNSFIVVLVLKEPDIHHSRHLPYTALTYIMMISSVDLNTATEQHPTSWWFILFVGCYGIVFLLLWCLTHHMTIPFYHRRGTTRGFKSVSVDVVWSHDRSSFSEAEEECVCCVWVRAHAQILSLHTNVDVCVCLLCGLCVSEGEQVRAGGYGSVFPQCSVC